MRAGETVEVLGKSTQAGIALQYAGRRITVEVRIDGRGHLYPALQKPWDPRYPRTDLSMEAVAFYNDHGRWFYYPDDALHERLAWEGDPAS
ncbi:hypothetical protein GCM10009733_020220 [Nonomuraea maheshkhaliensis]|uniref:Uncharacterized protein n=1 Tax=Nonomuraea maheshkhaliensis TaxID=419590 RepID=A0ABN2EZE1_9ACTN